MLQIREALAQACQRLSTDSAQLDAEVLLAKALDKPRVHLKTWPEKTLTEDQSQLYWQLIQRRQDGEPIAHITGEREFWSRSFQVTEHTLIPRPETEHLIEQALNLLPPSKHRVIDLGTGTGAIAITLACERPQWDVWGIDASPDALAIAEQNGRQHQANVTWKLSHWLEQVDGKFDLIVSNPPYIADNDPHLSQGDVQFEPKQALTSGTDGLNDIRHLIAIAPNYLLNNGWLLLEHGYDQQAAILALLSANHFQNIQGMQDSFGQDRLVIAQKPA